MMSYQDALDFLYGLINHKRSRQERNRADQSALERTRAVLASVEHPQKAYPIVHVTGTKGKGSVGAMCAAMLRAAGLRVGLFSSPHLQDFRERFKINDALIAEADIVHLVDELRPAVTDDLIWFEMVTALALLYFQREAVDMAVVEVGIGGRLDATNVVHPEVSIITSLSLDHTALLGHTLAEIAFEKAGIIKPGVPVISAPQAPEALDVIMQRAEEVDAPLTLIGRDWQFEALGGNFAMERFAAAPTGHPLQPYETNLLGEHQVINATVALAALHQLDIHAADGLKQVNWPGRLEIVRREPLTILDAAHNADSAMWLGRALKQRFAAEWLVLVFAAKVDKDIRGMLQALLPMTDVLIVTQAVDSRAEDPAILAEMAREQGHAKPILILPTVADALAAAAQHAGNTGTVCITGSLYLVGEARTIYELPVATTYVRA